MYNGKYKTEEESVICCISENKSGVNIFSITTFTWVRKLQKIIETQKYDEEGRLNC